MTRIQLAETAEKHIQSRPGVGLVESIEVVFSFQLLIDDCIDGWNSPGPDLETTKSCLKTAASMYIYTYIYVHIMYIVSATPSFGDILHQQKSWTSAYSISL